MLLFSSSHDTAPPEIYSLSLLDALPIFQQQLLAEADRHQIPIIPNVEISETVRLVMETIADRLAQEYNGTPEVVFAET